jgi:hypothetical protein
MTDSMIDAMTHGMTGADIVDTYERQARAN